MVQAIITALLTQLSALSPLEADSDGAAAEPANDHAPEIVGWFDPSRVELATPLGPLPFVIETGMTAYSHTSFMDDFAAAHYAAARVRNGDSETVTRLVEVHATGYLAPEHRAKARSYARIEFAEYQSVLSGSRGPSCVLGAPIGDYMPLGTWRIRRDGFMETVSFTAKRAKSPDDRFDPVRTNAPTADLDGAWLVRLEESEERASGLFTVNGDQVDALLITPDGLLRDFGGRIDGGFLRLSYFDGRDAYLIHARVQDDGSLRGVLCEGNWRQEVWTAVRE